MDERWGAGSLNLMDTCQTALEYAIEARSSSRRAHERLNELKSLEAKIDHVIKTLHEQKGASDEQAKNKKINERKEDIKLKWMIVWVSALTSVLTLVIGKLL